MVSKFFPKTDSVNENARVFSFQTQIVFDYLYTTLTKTSLFTTTQKAQVFCFLFEIYLLHYFHHFSFFLQHKKDKSKNCTFFHKPCFDIPTTCKTFFASLHTICDYFKITPPSQKKHAKTSWTNFWLNLGPIADSKRSIFGPILDSTAYTPMFTHKSSHRHTRVDAMHNFVFVLDRLSVLWKGGACTSSDKNMSALGNQSYTEPGFGKVGCCFAPPSWWHGIRALLSFVWPAYSWRKPTTIRLQIPVVSSKILSPVFVN